MKRTSDTERRAWFPGLGSISGFIPRIRVPGLNLGCFAPSDINVAPFNGCSAQTQRYRRFKSFATADDQNNARRDCGADYVRFFFADPRWARGPIR